MKKLVIAAMLSAPVAAFAGMTSLDDTTLSAVSGQDGISIEQKLNADIDSIVYTDTINGSKANAGAVSIDGLHISQAAFGKTDIDVATDGNLPARLTLTNAASSMNVLIDSVAMGQWDAAGTSLAKGGSLGTFALTGINLAGNTTSIWGHDGKSYGLVAGKWEVVADGTAGSIKGDGATGIAVMSRTNVAIDNVSYNDKDLVVDYSAATGGVGGNAVKAGNLHVNNIKVSSNSDSLMLVDAVKEGTQGKLQLTMGSTDLNISVGGIYIGGYYDAASKGIYQIGKNDGTAVTAGPFGAMKQASLGALDINSLKMANTAVKIYAH